jgi:hypothetical protein
MADREVNVTTYAGYKGGERPKSFTVGEKVIEVVEIVKMWIEEGRDDRRRRRFFTVKGSDGDVHTVYSDETAQRWYLKQTGVR